jgi:hypothetical protein
MQGVPHPINDPALVSYHRPEVIRILPSLELASDCWYLLDGTFQDSRGGVRDLKAKYLKQEDGEPNRAYEGRLMRSTYAPVYRDSIRAYAGLLSRFQIVDGPASMLQAEKNIDLQGESLQSFWNKCDEKALRDGGVYVMVDMTPDDEEQNFFDEQTVGRRPYLLLIDRKDVINWSVTYENGRERISHATIRQIRQNVQPGSYGVELEAIYHVVRPGLVETYRMEKNGMQWRQVKEREIATSIPVVPIAWYGATASRFATGDIPLNGLAQLSIQHFQMRSDLHELIHKCAMPVPVRTGAKIGPDGQPLPLVLGPNTAVDLDAEGGKFEFAEPSGRSLERHQAEIRHVEELMDRSSLNFLYGAEVKTATEASLRAAQVASKVASLVRNKTSSFNLVMRLWAVYNGEVDQINQESGISMNDSLINKPMDASDVAQLVNLYSQGLVSKRTVLDELQRGGVLDPDLKVEDELSRVEEDHQSQLDQMIEDEEKMAEMSDTTAPEVGDPPINGDSDGQPIPDVETPERVQASSSRAQ